ncbi:regulator of chromosome condensation [Acrasis kona]|uniref:Regulator of chromosome condensation n=1 Tax=Acrasis kona TaxID=1008807 RepID=A0AAW2ZMT6_9EUKA
MHIKVSIKKGHSIKNRTRSAKRKKRHNNKFNKQTTITISERYDPEKILLLQQANKTNINKNIVEIITHKQPKSFDFNPVETTCLEELQRLLKNKLNSTGRVYSFGFSQSGLLGRCISDLNYNAPGEVDGLRNKQIKQIEIGDDCCAAVTHDGDMYVWSKSTTSRNERVSKTKQNIRLLLSNVVQVSISQSMLILLANNVVLMCNGSFFNRKEAIVVKGLEHVTVKLVSCGESSCCVVSDSGEMYMIKVNGVAHKYNEISNVKSVMLNQKHTVALTGL